MHKPEICLTVTHTPEICLTVTHTEICLTVTHTEICLTEISNMPYVHLGAGNGCEPNEFQCDNKRRVHAQKY